MKKKFFVLLTIVISFSFFINLGAAEIFKSTNDEPSHKWMVKKNGWKIWPVARGVSVSAYPTDTKYWQITGLLTTDYTCPSAVIPADQVHQMHLDSDRSKNEILLYVNEIKGCPHDESGMKARVTYEFNLGRFSKEAYPTVQMLPKMIVNGQEALVYSYYPDGSLATYPEVPPTH